MRLLQAYQYAVEQAAKGCPAYAETSINREYPDLHPGTMVRKVAWTSLHT